MHSDHVLRVVMYHYVRDLPRTQFPRLKGMLTEDFRHQVNELSSIYEMASIESALDFMTGEYRPRRLTTWGVTRRSGPHTLER